MRSTAVGCCKPESIQQSFCGKHKAIVKDSLLMCRSAAANHGPLSSSRMRYSPSKPPRFTSLQAKHNAVTVSAATGCSQNQPTQACSLHPAPAFVRTNLAPTCHLLQANTGYMGQQQLLLYLHQATPSCHSRYGQLPALWLINQPQQHQLDSESLAHAPQQRDVVPLPAPQQYTGQEQHTCCYSAPRLLAA